MPRTPRASAWETYSTGLTSTQRTIGASHAMDFSVDSVANVTAAAASRRTTLGRRVWTCSMKGSRSVKADSVKFSSPATTVWRPAVRMGCSEYSVTLVIFHSPAFVLLGHRSLLNQHASGGLRSGIGTCTEFRKVDPACLGRGRRMTSRAAPAFHG